MNKFLSILAVIFIGGSILAYHSAFIVQQTQEALVVEFGEIQRVVQEPGLEFKLPYQSVLHFDKRLLQFDAKPDEFITKDVIETREGLKVIEERVVIDAFLLYRIVDPVQFYQSVKSEANLRTRLNGIVQANMRNVLATVSLGDLLSERRNDIMARIQEGVNAQVSGVAETTTGENGQVRGQQSFGIEIADLRIKRADLPDAILQSTFERMRKSFTKKAQRFRAEGEQIKLEIRSAADREKVNIIAQAQKEAETTRGEGDGVAAKTYADAFNKDPKFFEFYRSMQAYKKALAEGDTTLILSPEHEFLKQMDQ